MKRFRIYKTTYVNVEVVISSLLKEVEGVDEAKNILKILATQENCKNKEVTETPYSCPFEKSFEAGDYYGVSFSAEEVK